MPQRYPDQLDERLVRFAVSVCQLISSLPSSLAMRRMGDQLIRSATSIGANYEEATAAESKADFIHKMQISLKEARESCYWLKVMEGSVAEKTESLSAVLNEAQQIRAMLTKAVFTTKDRMRGPGIQTHNESRDTIG
jgi:four helix bundle protein